MLNEHEYSELLDKVRQSVDTEALLSNEFMTKLISAVIKSHEELLHRQRCLRQSKIMSEAKRRGVRIGRPPMRRAENTEEVLNAYRRGELSVREAARRIGVSHKTVSNWAAEFAVSGE